MSGRYNAPRGPDLIWLTMACQTVDRRYGRSHMTYFVENARFQIDLDTAWHIFCGRAGIDLSEVYAGLKDGNTRVVCESAYVREMSSYSLGGAAVRHCLCRPGLTESASFGLETREADTPHSDRDRVRPGSFAKRTPLPAGHHATSKNIHRGLDQLGPRRNQSRALTWFPAYRRWSAIGYVVITAQSDTCLAHLNSYDLLCH